MKKHLKKIILVLGIVFLSVAGYLLYIFQFKEYETADENVDKVIEEEYEVELPDGSVIIVDKEGKVVENADAQAADGEESGEGAVAEGAAASGEGSSKEGSSSESTTADGAAAGSGDSTSTASGGTATGSASTTSGTASSSSNGSSADKAAGATGSTGSATGGSGSNAGSGSSGSGSSGNGSTGSSTGSGSNGSGSTDGSDDEAGVTVASIKQKYVPTLADIEGQAASRIGGLIGAAQTEYDQKKANGENINYAYFYNKYVNAASELENRTDTVFYAVIGSLKNELKANGLAESHAESFVTEYEARKAERKKDLISKASGL